MAKNYVLLQTTQLTSSAASVTFSNIPQSGYTDLKIVMSVRNTRSSSGPGYGRLLLNNSSANFTYKGLYTNEYGSAGSNSRSDNYSFFSMATNYLTSSTFCNTEVYIPNYSSSTQYKTISIDELNETNSSIEINKYLSTVLWSNNSAITSITISADTNEFVQYSTFSLYGLAATGTTPVTAPKARGGNTVVTDGTYWYHAFLTSGYFTPLVGLTCDALVIAGGGGGGNNSSGGGGAGGYRGFTSQSLTATNYPIIVGAGGAAATSGSASSVSGTSLTASGGGKGGDANTDGTSGGSGGGAGGKDPNDRVGGSGNAGSYSPVEGYAGGANASTASSNNRATGGGGGAGGAGGNGTTGVSGNGGAGSNTYSSWASVTNTGVSGYFAGGGGGGIGLNGTSAGTGGSGGGANGIKGDNVTGYSATVNTGSGGGGTGTNASTGGAGGSGIIIIRYAV
jgi:hypothetical protein